MSWFLRLSDSLNGIANIFVGDHNVVSDFFLPGENGACVPNDNFSSIYITKPESQHALKLKELWQRINNEHALLLTREDVDLEDPKILDETKISEHTRELVSFLVRERKDLASDIGERTIIGDDETPSNLQCEEMLLENHSKHSHEDYLMFALNNNVVFDLCCKGHIDCPKGTLSLVLASINQLIQKTCHQLLSYPKIREPLGQLIGVAFEIGDEYAHEELVNLLNAVWLKIRRDNSLLKFFLISSSHATQGQVDIFSPLIAMAMEDSHAGNRARTTILYMASIRNASLHRYMINQTNLCSTIAQTLSSNFHYLTSLGTQWIEETTTNPFTSNTNDALEQKDEYTALAAEAKLFLCWKFTNAICMSCIGEAGFEGYESLDSNDSNTCHANSLNSGILSQGLIACVKREFFQQCVWKKLSTTGEDLARFSLLLVSSLINIIKDLGFSSHSELLWSLVSMLIHTDDHASVDVSSVDGRVGCLQTMLLFRTDSLSTRLSTAALKLFDVLLGLDDPRVVDALCIRQLRIGNFLSPSTVDDGKFEKEYEVNNDKIGYETPKKIVQVSRKSPTMSNVSRLLDRCPGSPRPPAMQNLVTKPFSSDARDSLLSFERYATDGHCSTVTKIAAVSSPMSDALSNLPATSKKMIGTFKTSKTTNCQNFKEGLFINMIFNKFESFLTNSLAENLMLTGILSKLVQHPNPILHSYLFEESVLKEKSNGVVQETNHSFGTFSKPFTSDGGECETSLAPARGIRTLISVIERVWKEAQEKARKVLNFSTSIRSMRMHMGISYVDNLDGTGVSFVDDQLDLYSGACHIERFLRSYIVLEEFIREVTSLLQAKNAMISFSGGLSRQQVHQ